MRLLIITQKVDRTDPVLGFFHTWIEKLAKKFESIVVICLGKGEYSLPENVKVLSLGKEAAENDLGYTFNFYRYIFGEINNYDAVFVHMNQEYVLLGGLFWKIFGKKVFLWRNHPKGSVLTWIAVMLSDKVFCTSPFSYTARFKKMEIMPVGIDTDSFKPQNAKRKKNSILFLGRIALVKNVHLFVEIMNILKNNKIKFQANIYGDALQRDQAYFQDIKNAVKNRGLEKELEFMGPVTNKETPVVYAAHDIYVNLTPTGSMDKTIFEAAACGTIPVVINMSLKEDLAGMVVYDPTPANIADKIEFWLKESDAEKEKTRENLVKYVQESHGLDALIDKLFTYIKV